ncbi:MAG: hypothetical protein FWG67_04780 [Defluviitaleaceae bacterium]|nr:hypothetical protein [Defluviitaleaceae bacterium]
MAVIPQSQCPCDAPSATMSTPTPSGAPTLLYAPFSTSNEVHLRWTPAIHAVNYQIYRGTMAENMELIGHSTTNEYLDKTVDPGMSYHYYVVALDGTHQPSAPSNTVLVLTSGLLAVPGHLHTMGAISPGHVDLMWAIVPGSVKTDLYRSVDEQNFTKIGHTDTPYDRFIDTTAQAGHTYFYQARSVDSSGQSSAASNTIRVTIPGGIETTPSGSLNPPMHLHVTNTTQTSLSLAWDSTQHQVTDGQYEIFRDGVQIAKVPAHVRTFIDHGLTPSTSYTYSVRFSAVSVHSNMAQGTTVAYTPTPQPEPEPTPASGLTFSISGEGTNRQQITVRNQTGANIPSLWQVNLTYTGGNPTFEWPANWAVGSNGHGATRINGALNNNGTITFPMGVNTQTRVTSLSVNGQSATRVD